MSGALQNYAGPGVSVVALKEWKPVTVAAGLG
jgi:hypothetical protein